MADDGSSGDFRLAAGRGYLMDSGNLEAVRLNYQYFLWKEALSFNIHSCIPRASLRTVADIATGTGIWLLDVSKELEAVASSSRAATTSVHAAASSISSSPLRLDGFDIDLTKVPHSAWLPPHVSFQHWNIFSEPPAHLHGTYDLVHVRLLVLAIEDASAARSVIGHLQKLLKPGGFLQWDELDVVNTSVRQPPGVSEPVPAPALEELMQKSRAGGRYDWTAQLGELVAEEGLEMVVTQRFGDPDELVRMLHEQHLLTMTLFARSLESIGKREAADRFAELVTAAHLEAINGAALCFPRVVLVAKKRAD